MDHAVLVGDFIAAGRKLVDALDREGFDVKAPLWLDEADKHRWKLVIASQKAAAGDIREAHKQIIQIIRDAPDIDMEPDDVSLTTPKDEFIRSLRSRYHIESGEPERRLTGTFVKSVPIDDAILYRVQ
jgi:hypothetical protein